MTGRCSNQIELPPQNVKKLGFVFWFYQYGGGYEYAVSQNQNKRRNFNRLDTLSFTRGHNNIAQNNNEESNAK